MAGARHLASPWGPLCTPDVGRRRLHGWVRGLELRYLAAWPRAMYLRFRDNSCYCGLQLATGDHSRLSCGVGQYAE
jgi:hypothetical protein